MVVNRSASVKEETVQDWMEPKIDPVAGESEFMSKGGVVHRLDKDTSGVMVLAKTQEDYEGLKQQFLERKTVKKYVALVHGVLKERQGIVSSPIERNPKSPNKFWVGTDLSRTAITEWKVDTIYREGYCLVDLIPLTGRTHQLRVHLSHMGHPIVSDPIYGWRKVLKKDLEWCPRLFLHARSIEFSHPRTGEKMSFDAPLPEELRQVVAGLTLDG